MRSLIVIPARYASTRFPGKPLALIGNKPVIRLVTEQALKVSQEVYVATDDQRIYDEVTSFGGKAVMTSPLHKSGTDRCFEAFQKIMELNPHKFDVIVNVQGDEPFIQPNQIQELIKSFEDSEVEIATLIKRIVNAEDIFDPNKVKVVASSRGRALYFSRSAIPHVRGKEKSEWLENGRYCKHIGMYAYRPEILEEITKLAEGELEKTESLEQLRWLENGYHIAVKYTGHESIGIDTPMDLEKANAIFDFGF